MTKSLTPRQKRIIQNALDDGKPLTGFVTASLGVPYQADLLILLEDNPGLFNGNLSRLVRDMIQSYKVDWRNDKNSQLDEILSAINKLKTVSSNDKVAPSEDTNDERKIDASGGFSES